MNTLSDRVRTAMLLELWFYRHPLAGMTDHFSACCNILLYSESELPTTKSLIVLGQNFLSTIIKQFNDSEKSKKIQEKVVICSFDCSDYQVKEIPNQYSANLILQPLQIRLTINNSSG